MWKYVALALLALSTPAYSQTLSPVSGLPVNNPVFTGTLVGPAANITSVVAPTVLGSPAGGALSLGADASHNGLVVTPSDAGGNATYLTPGGVDSGANLFIGSRGSTSTVNISGNGLSLLSETPTMVVSGVTGQDSYVLINGSTTPLPIVSCGGGSCGLSFDTSAGQAIVLPAATHNANVVGALTVGSATSATVSSGEVAQPKITASGTAPGAGSAKFLWVAGTNAATCKLISYAGTSTTPVTIVDNVGSGC